MPGAGVGKWDSASFSRPADASHGHPAVAIGGQPRVDPYHKRIFDCFVLGHYLLLHFAVPYDFDALNWLAANDFAFNMQRKLIRPFGKDFAGIAAIDSNQ